MFLSDFDRCFRGCLILAVFVVMPALAEAQSDPAARFAAYEKHVAMKEESLFKDLPWQFLGPTNVSGRITDLAVATPRGKTYVMYAATATGGVWKTENDGSTWKPVFEHAPSTCIGDVTLAPSNQDIVWVGTGEANIFRSSMAGCGVYKSEDAGATWKHMGLAGTHTIPRIVIHPTNPDLVYVASSGHEWTDNEERGVYRSMDGGTSWTKVLYVDEKTGIIDLVMDPSDSDTLYASSWQRIRRRWNDPRNEPGYSGSGIFKSTDGGESWSAINEGLPEARHRGRIGIDVARSDPKVVYAFVDNYEIYEGPSRRRREGENEGEEQEGEGGEEEGEGTDSYGRRKSKTITGAELYRSNDGGGTWSKVSESNRYMRGMSSTYGWVFGQMRVDPNDADTVYLMGLALNVSNDSGKTFRRLRGMHGDHHALWIDPENSSYLVNGNDGGFAVSHDGGVNWRTSRNTLPAVQFYNVGFDMAEPFHVYGSIQDHGSRRGTVDISRGRDRIQPVEWESAPGGEASRHSVDPTDENVVYSEGFYGSIGRRNLATGDRARLAPRAAEGEEPLRGQWLAPFIISPHNPRIIYHGMNFLYCSLDRGDKFEKISPDLSRNLDGEKGDIPYQTIFAISESPISFGHVYAGTDDGRAWRTPNGGTDWVEITKGLAGERWISAIEASRFDKNTVYLSQNGKRHDDFAAYLWKSTDCGDTWQDISGNIPCGPINVVREDPRNGKILYVGTDLGAYVTVDGGATWHVLANGLSATFVQDITIHPRDRIIVIATHGRGMYAMDAIPIQDHGKPKAESPAEAPKNPERRRRRRR